MSEERYQQGPFIFPIPIEWEVETLDSLTELITRGKQPDYTSDDDDSIPVLNQKCIYWDGFRYENQRYTSLSDWSQAKHYPEEGDILINSTGKGTVGRSLVYDGGEKRVIDSHITRVVPKDTIVSHYLRYYLQSDTGSSLLQSMGVNGSTGQIELSRQQLGFVPVSVPPVPEQERIASVLYSVDEHVRTLDNRHATLTDHKQALMQDLLTGVKRVAPDMTVLDTISEHQSEIEQDTKNKPSICLDYDMGKNPDGSASYSRPTWSGAELPEGWSCKTVSQECEIQGGKAFSGDRFSKRYQESGCPLVKRATVNNKRPPVQFLRGDFDDRYSVKKGDILVSMDGNFNSLLWGFGDAALNQRVCSINPNDTSFNNYFLSHAIKMPLQFTEDSTGATTVKSLSVNDFDYIEIPTPELWEQERIASILYTVDEMIARTASLRDEYERLKQGLMQDLLSGDVRTPEQLDVLESVTG